MAGELQLEGLKKELVDLRLKIMCLEETYDLYDHVWDLKGRIKHLKETYDSMECQMEQRQQVLQQDLRGVAWNLGLVVARCRLEDQLMVMAWQEDQRKNRIFKSWMGPGPSSDLFREISPNGLPK